MNKIYFGSNSISNFNLYGDYLYVNMIGGQHSQICVHEESKNVMNKMVEKLISMLRGNIHYVCCYDFNSGKLTIE